MISRLPIVRILFVLAALTGLLAGCRRDVSATAPSAEGAPATGGAHGSSAAGSPAATSTGSATSSATDCPEPLASNTYVRAASAHAEGSTVVVTANLAQRVCGGADNGHYEVEADTEQLTMTASATVVLLTTTPSGVGHETVAPADLPQRLIDDRFGRIFLVRGPLTAVTSLEEQYHP